MSTATSQNQTPEELTFLPLFDRFYTEVDRLRTVVTAPSSSGGDDGGLLGGVDATLTAEGVRRKLVAVLEDLSADFGRQTDSFEYQQFRQVLYIMAALADEIFLGIDWYGRVEWRDNLIETELFDSHDAGDRFYELLDDLIEGRDSSYRNVAAIYLLALSLGFQGRHAASDRTEEIIGEYRNKLYTFIYSARPGRRLESTPLCPQAGWYTISGSAPERFPTARWWLLGGALSILLLLLGSHFVWEIGTGDLYGVLEDIAVAVP